MSPEVSRRAFIAGALAVSGAVMASRVQPRASQESRFGGRNIGASSRKPLLVALLDRHADRLQVLLPDLEQHVGRRVVLEGQTFDQLYANFTFDLLQQTGRYDIVSMSDSWIPYFGRPGYFSEVQFSPEEGGPRSYPVRIAGAATGADGTPLVAHPWTFDFVCSAFPAEEADPGSTSNWIAYMRRLREDATLTVSVPLLPERVASQAFRAVALSYGQDIIDAGSNEPGLDRYGSQRAMVVLNMLAAKSGVEDSLQLGWPAFAQLTQTGAINHAPITLASDLGPLLATGRWRNQLLPAGRVNRNRTSGEIWMLAVPAGAPSLDEARAAIRWLTSTAVQQRLWGQAALLPATRPAINDSAGSLPREMQLLMLDALDALQPIPRLRSFQSVMSIIGQNMPAIVRDPANTDQNLSRVNEEARERLIEEGELQQ